MAGDGKCAAYGCIPLIRLSVGREPRLAYLTIKSQLSGIRALRAASSGVYKASGSPTATISSAETGGSLSGVWLSLGAQDIGRRHARGDVRQISV
jgi:hypothetical protein